MGIGQTISRRLSLGKPSFLSLTPFLPRAPGIADSPSPFSFIRRSCTAVPPGVSYCSSVSFPLPCRNIFSPQGRLFPRYHLIRHSQIFADMFNLPQATSSTSTNAAEILTLSLSQSRRINKAIPIINYSIRQGMCD